MGSRCSAGRPRLARIATRHGTGSGRTRRSSAGRPRPARIATRPCRASSSGHRSSAGRARPARIATCRVRTWLQRTAKQRWPSPVSEDRNFRHSLVFPLAGHAQRWPFAASEDRNTAAGNREWGAKMAALAVRGQRGSQPDSGLGRAPDLGSSAGRPRPMRIATPTVAFSLTWRWAALAVCGQRGIATETCVRLALS